MAIDSGSSIFCKTSSLAAPVAIAWNPEVRGPSGVLQKDVCTWNGSLLAKLTRSKTIGAGRDLPFRHVVVGAASHVQEPTWPVDGWDLLCRAAPNERDCLLPSPKTTARGCESTELSYGTAFTIRSRVPRVLDASRSAAIRLPLDASQRALRPVSDIHDLTEPARLKVSDLVNAKRCCFDFSTHGSPLTSGRVRTRSQLQVCF